MRVLLDTFPFIWLTSEPSKLSRLASEVLSDQKNEFYLSDASVLELSLKFLVPYLTDLPLKFNKFF